MTTKRLRKAFRDNRVRKVTIFTMILCCSILLSGVLFAQTFRGTILGTVTDSSGAVLPGAKVTVRNSGTGIERTSQTSADGSYRLSELPNGTYTVIVEAQAGFQSSITNNVTVDVAAERRVDVILKPGDVSQRIEVSGDALPQVETTSAQLGGTLTTKTIDNLPVNGRDYTKLIFLNPGIAGSPDQITDSPGSEGTFSMNGQRGRANNFLLDGTDMNDGYRNDPAINEAGVMGDPATILPLDAIAELSVLSNYEAEYGRNSGAVVNIVTKSGTNTLHGSAFEYWRSGQIGARNFFNNVGSKNLFLNNQFGGSLGGPVLKGRTFFYLNYEGQRETGAQSTSNCVPDPSVIAATEQTITSQGLQVSQTITNLLARNPWPTPNIPGVTNGNNGSTCVLASDLTTPANNLATSTSFRNRIDSAIVKLDHNFNSANQLSGRYYFGNGSQSFPLGLGSAGVLPGFNTVTPTRVQLVSISYIKVVNSNQINEARVGWNRFTMGFFPEDSSFNPESIGLDTGVSETNFGLPKIRVGAFTVIGANSAVPRSRVDSNWHAIDNYSSKIGRHDLKFGYEFRRTTISLFENTNFRGKLSFTNLSTFLQGLPSSGSEAEGNTQRNTFENSQALYVQDSFRATPRLTLNYGLRWEYLGVVGEKNHLFYQFDPSANSVIRVGAGGGPSSLYKPEYTNFAPRVAFAYDVSGASKTVIRGGWGLFFDAFSQDVFLGHVPYNCAFCPGPAFTGTGPAAINSSSVVSGVAIAPDIPVYGAPSSLKDFFGIDPNIRTPYVQNFNLNIQQKITGAAVLQVGYVGALGRKLFRFRDINQPSQSMITAADEACGCILGFDASSNVPRPYSNFFYVNQEESTSNSNYHALQTSLRIASWRGLSSQVNFVWSHSIDNASDSEDFIPNAAQPNNSLAPQLERGNSSFDIRRRFTWNFGYQLPAWKGTSTVSKITNGWGFDGIVSLQDGQPFQLNYNYEGDYSGSGEGFDRPDVVGPVQYGSGASNFLNLASFAVPCTFGNPSATTSSGDSNCIPGTRHFGNMGRNSLRAPSFKEVNPAIFKNTPLSERVNLQFRAEFFNIFNHPNFANPVLPAFIADPATNGLNGNGRGIGYLPLTATDDVGVGNPFLGGGGPRGVQFALKLTF
jgi:hypothetical protein